MRPPLTRRSRACVRLIAMIALAAIGFASGATAQTGDDPIPEMKGVYEGVGPSNGMRIVIDDVDRKPGGTFRDSNGKTADIGGGWKAGGLEAILVFPGRPVFVRITPEALGISMTVLPFDQEGNPDPSQARILGFLKEGLDHPEQPALYQDPPPRSDQETDADVFLVSYQFWPPVGVANGFAQIGNKYRTLIRLFPMLHADVLWKMCQTSVRQDLVAEALRGQGATCGTITAAVDGSMRNGRFAEWKADVKKDIDALFTPIQCARGYIVRAEVCEPASAEIAKAAVSLETIGSKLERW